MAGSQDFAADPRNANARIWLQGNLVTRANAKVSVFDAGFVVGDGVWEGLRLHKGKLVFLDAHLDRLFAGAKAINLDIGLTRQGVMDATVPHLGAMHLVWATQPSVPNAMRSNTLSLRCANWPHKLMAKP